MKQTKTTLKELTAMYRAVLHHGILCNAIALGLIATTPAMAEVITQQQVIDTDTPMIVSGVEASGLDAGASWGAAYYVVNGDLTINDSAFSGNAAMDQTYGYGGAINNGGTLTINGSTFTGNMASIEGGAVDNAGILTINGSTFGGAGASDGNVAYTGGALGNYGGSATLNNSNFVGNSANVSGGAVFVYGGSLTVENGTSFVDNKMTSTHEQDEYAMGGGAIVASDAALSVSDAIFSGNTSAEIGGAIYKSGSGNTSISDSSFTANSATGNAGFGGALVIDQYNTGTVSLDGLTFGDGTLAGANHADEAGAAWFGVAATVENSTFNYNTARNGGAVVTGGSGRLTLTNSTFLNNIADGNGGAIATRKKGNAGTSFLHITGDGTSATMFSNNSAANGGAIYTGTTDTTIADTLFTGNTATGDGGAIFNEGTLTVSNSVFGDADNAALKNTAGIGGGAVYNIGSLDVLNSNFYNNDAVYFGAIRDKAGGTYVRITDSNFVGNTAEEVGAVGIFSRGDLSSVSGSLFEKNKATGTGAGVDGTGALFVGAEARLTVSGTTFTENESAAQAGAIGTRDFKQGVNSAAKLDIVGSTFTKNKAATEGGAINNYLYNDADGDGYVKVTGSTFTENEAAKGGAIYNHISQPGDTYQGQTGSMYFADSNFTGNIASDLGGAIYNEGMLTLNSSTFTDNTATRAGGAIYNDNGTITANGSLFKSNNDGAIYSNKGTITLTDTSFKNNTGEDFGAIGLWNGRNSVVTINAQDADVVFSGNTATEDADAGDIYNSKGTINLNAANGKTISMDGGIVGAFGSEKLNINSVVGNTGTIDIAGALKNHIVSVDAGELHLSNGVVDGSNVADSEITVADGATINTIDNLVNDYTDAITLKNGAGVKGDIDYTAGLADTYSANSGANITYKMANALNLSGIQYGSKEIAVTNSGATINADAGFAWFNGDTGLTLTSGGAGTGTVLVSGVAGGINAAVDATDDTVQEVNYTLNGNDTFSGTVDNVIQKADFTITGNGNDANTSDKIVFNGEDMVVDGNSTLTLNDVVLEKTNDEAIVNQAGATLNIKDSRIAVNVNNYGTMVSDPTYYDAQVVNSGDATFTEDVFENGSSLTNSATVNLNNVEFVSGSTLTGLAGNVLNVAGTDNKFNGTSTGNNVVLANGANFVGTLSDGVVDARNGGIDTITGSVSGGDLYVDANLNAGTVDTFGGTTGATVKGIKLAGTAYGNADKVELTIGDAALDSNLEIDGTNYFTSVVKDGDNIVFSDKLINESNLYNKLGSWTSGNYIKSNVDMANPADTDHLTVGSALAALDTAIGDMSGFGSQNYAKNTGSVAANITALDTQLKTVSTEGEIASGNTGFVSGGAVYTALADKQDTLTAGSVALDKLATTDLSQFDNSTSGFITKDVNNLTNYTTTSDMTDAITTAKDAAISAAATDATTKANQALADAKTYADGLASNYDAAGAAATAKSEAIAAAATDATTKANQALADAQAYIDGKGYQNATQVGDAIDTKIANLDLANTYEAKGAAATAETNAKAYADSLASNYDAAGAAATAETNAKAYADSLASNYDAAGAAATAETNAKSYVDTKLADYTTTADMNTAIAGKQDAIVDNAFIVTDGAGGLKVADASVTDAHLAANAVTTAKVADGAITTVKVADGAITSDKLDSGVQASLTKANNAVQTVSTGTTDGTITVDGTEVAVAGWNTKQDAISNTSTIVADGTGLKVADGSIGATQLDSSVNASLTKADNSVQSVTTGSSNGTINVDGTDVAVAGLGSLAYEDAASFETAGAAATAEANAKAYTDARLSALHDNSVEMANAYTDKRIESLDKNLSAGVAGAVALSAVATSGVERGEVSVGAGYGYFNGQSAAAFGATMGLTNRWSINAGAGISNADVSFRAGTNYKFKLF